MLAGNVRWVQNYVYKLPTQRYFTCNAVGGCGFLALNREISEPTNISAEGPNSENLQISRYTVHVYDKQWTDHAHTTYTINYSIRIHTRRCLPAKRGRSIMVQSQCGSP